jgi:aspartate/methionine/tyrosine aminotransferase
MSAFIACTIRQGDVVAVTDPGYPAFARMAQHRHAEVKNVLLDPERDFAPALESLTDSDLDKLRVIALNYPNNPTGAVISQQMRAVVHATAEETGAVVFNDAVYGPLTFTDSSCCLLSGAAGNNFGDDLVELHSLTKLYPLGPQSGSFLVGSEETILEIANYSEFAWAPMSALQLGATTWCLGDTEGRGAIREFYREQLDILRDALTELGFAVYPTPSGIYALCKVPAGIGEVAVKSAAEAAAILLDDYNIAVVPFDVPGNSYLRFCSMFQPEDMQRLLTAGLQIRG